MKTMFRTFRLAVGAVLTAAMTISAATHCVRPDGADGCYTTIQAAIDAAAANDTVLVYPGEYWESVLIAKAGLALLAKGEPCEVSVLPSAGDGIKVTSAGAGASVQGFYIEAPTGTGIWVEANSGSVYVRNCVITRCAGRGIWGNGNAQKFLQNNVIVNNGSIGVHCDVGSFYLRNNIIDSNQYGVSVDYSGSAQLEYNNVWANRNGNYSGLSAPPFDTQVDPQFDSLNCYHLLPSSPCINAGDPGTTYLDCDGTRNDMGVYGGRYAYCGPGPVVTELRLEPATVVNGETFTIKATGAAR